FGGQGRLPGDTPWLLRYERAEEVRIIDQRPSSTFDELGRVRSVSYLLRQPTHGEQESRGSLTHARPGNARFEEIFEETPEVKVFDGAVRPSKGLRLPRRRSCCGDLVLMRKDERPHRTLEDDVERTGDEGGEIPDDLSDGSADRGCSRDKKQQG